MKEPAIIRWWPEKEYGHLNPQGTMHGLSDIVQLENFPERMEEEAFFLFENWQPSPQVDRFHYRSTKTDHFRPVSGPGGRLSTDLSKTMVNISEHLLL
jgi:hypothetical protein